MMAFLMDFNFTCIDSVCWLKLSRCFICRVESVNMLAAITRLPVPDLLNLYHIVYESMTWYIYIWYIRICTTWIYLKTTTTTTIHQFTGPFPGSDPIHGVRQCPNWTWREQHHKRHRNSWCRCAGSGDGEFGTVSGQFWIVLVFSGENPVWKWFVRIWCAEF